MAKAIKRIFFFLFGILFLLIVGGIALSYIYKDEIAAKVKSDINKNFNAVIDYGSVDLSIIKSFPDFSFQMNDFSITGIEEFKELKLIDAKQMAFNLDIMSVIKSDRPIEIHSVHLKEPKVNVKVLGNGKANYDITLPSEETTSDETYSFVVQLQEYGIEDGTITYEDIPGDIFLELLDLDHQGKGNFTQDVYDIYTKTNISSITAKTGGIKYVNKAKGDLDITLNANMKKMRFTLKDNELMLNALKLKADGFVEVSKNSDITTDLKFDAPGNKFKNFLSLIPSAYTKDFKDVKASGDLAFNGFVKGVYNADKNKMPAFKLNLDVKNGDFKYPTLPLGVNNIFAKASINSPSSNFDKMTVNVPAFKMKLGNNPFEASFVLKTPISDPDIDTKMKGTIDLAELVKAFPMEGVKTLNGVITTNMTAKTKMSYIDRQDYENVDMKGDMRIQKMNYKAEGMPPINIKDMDMAFTPKNVKVDNFDAKLGKSDLKAQGTVDNMLAYFSPEKTMMGNLVVRSNYFDANEWLSEEPAASTTPTTTETTAVFDRFKFQIDGIFKNLDYDIYRMKNMELKGNVSPNLVAIQNFEMEIGNSDIQGSGNLRNIFNYLYKNETLAGQLELNSKFMDLNQFMVDPEASGTAAAKTIAYKEEVTTGPLLIPENIDVDVDANFGKVRYTNIDLKNVQGKLKVEDQAVKLKNCKARTLGGSMIMNGDYDTKNPKKPTFDLDYKVQSFQFKQAFEKLNTIRMLAPIAQFIDGNFNTNLKMNGVVGQDMLPDLNTLTADGLFHTLNGVIKSFKPLEKLGNQLNISAFKTLKIKDTKNWFTLKNGAIEVKEFDYKFQDIAMKIGGKHGIDQEMDYMIKAKVPRKSLEKNVVGSAANKGLDFLSKEAAKYGVNINAGEYINLNINVGGNVKKPTIKIKPVGSEGNSPTSTAKDAIKDLGKKAADEAKKRAEAEAKKAADKAKTKAKAEADKVAAAAKAKAAKEAKKLKDKLAKEAADKAAKKLEEAAGEKAKTEIDKIRDKAEKWNPFKKKKKEDEGGK